MSDHRSATLTFRESFGKAGFFGKIALILSAWFGAGLLPMAPGTWGSLLGLPLVLFMNRLPSFGAGAFLVLFAVLATWSSHACLKFFPKEDPSEIVIDEVAGLLLALFLVPPSGLPLLGGFFLFRFFDILKPFPIKRFEKLRGGFGIVSDDLVAGLYANVCLRLILFFLVK
jgi:phosphatidylglycerophosphatase A